MDKIKGEEKHLELIHFREYYALQMPNVTPTAQTRWNENGIDFERWETVDVRAFKTTMSSKLQS